MSTITERISSLRESAGMSQAEAAARSVYSQPTWARIESGAKAAHLGDALAIASALGVFPSTVTGRSTTQDALLTVTGCDSGAADSVVLVEMGFYLEAKSSLRSAGFIL